MSRAYLKNNSPKYKPRIFIKFDKLRTQNTNLKKNPKKEQIIKVLFTLNSF